MKLDRTFRYARAAVALTAALAAARLARADDFTFSVPVELHALPSSTSARGGGVRCWAYSAVPASAAPGGDTIGTGITGIPLTNGSYQGTVMVHFNAAAGKRLENAKGYRCVLLFLEADGKEAPAAGWSHKQGTSYSDDVRGAINP